MEKQHCEPKPVSGTYAVHGEARPREPWESMQHLQGVGRRLHLALRGGLPPLQSLRGKTLPGCLQVKWILLINNTES